MPVTVDLIALGAVCGAISAIWGVIVLISKPLRKMRKTFETECQRNRRQDVQIIDSLKQRQLIVVSLLAVIDGLTQMGANHNVSTQKQVLLDYLNNRPFDTSWYKDLDSEKE